jgi:D-tyrosyl-tRNA(Tyr) deacylase
MRVVVQRVSHAQVEIDSLVVGQIQRGFLLFVGICEDDTFEDADWLTQKIADMRIFSDENGKMNLSLHDIGASVLIVSQFTLFASTKKGNRPSFIAAAQPQVAIPLYEYFVKKFESRGILTETGKFGADMKVSLCNDGPVTILIDSKNRE